MTDLPSRAPAESQEFYRRVVGLEPVMDLGWIVSLADPSGPGSVSACDPDGKVVNVLSHR